MMKEVDIGDSKALLVHQKGTFSVKTIISERAKRTSTYK